MNECKIVGIVNITNDSFSDGKLFIKPDKAIQKARELYKESANIIDLGAQSSNPDSQIISANEEINRLMPVINKLKEHKIPISIDTCKNRVINAVLEKKIDMINDIKALGNINEENIEKLKTFHNVKIVLMHSVNAKEKATKTQWKTDSFIKEIISFFNERLNCLVKKGLNEKRFIIDPGMGFFLSSAPKASLSVLKNLHTLKKYFNNKIYISVSRKSFIGNTLNKKEISERQAGTLAAEIYAFTKGVNYIRTHEPKALNDAITITKAIMNS